MNVGPSMLRRSRAALLIAPLLLALAAAGPAAAGDPVELSEWLPDWEEGMWWEVKTRPLAVAAPMAPGGPLHERSKDPVTIRFEVTGKKDIEGSSCWEATVTNPLAPDLVYVLYVRRRDYVVAEMHTVSKTGKTEKRSVKKHGTGPFVLLEETFICPLDLPTFPAEEKDEEVSGTLAGTKVPYVEKRSFVKQGGETVFRVEIHTEHNGKPLVSAQTWRKGGPWYATASRRFGEREAEIGETVKAGTK